MNKVISPYMENDPVTKEDFRDFKTDTEIRFDNVEYSIKELKTFVIDGFEGMERYVDNSFMYFEERFEKKMDEIKSDIIVAINKQ